MLYLYALCALLLAYAPSSQAKDLYYDHYLKTGINAGEMPMSVMLAQGFTEDHAPFKPINHTFYLNEHEHCDLGCKYNLYRMHFNKTTVATRGTLQVSAYVRL